MSAEALPANTQPAVTDRLLTVSFGGSNLAAITDVKEMPWPEFAAMLTKQPPETEDKASVGWYAAADFKPVYRHGDNLVARHALTLDYDVVTQNDGKTIRDAYNGLAHALYTTWSHTKEKPRIRVVLPLSRPVNADEFCAVSRHVAALAGIELAARESHVPAQCMFLPARKPGASFRGIVHAGKWVDVDAVLASYADWTDRTSWPKRADGDSTHHGATAQVPTDKVGIVGDFCRAFDVPAAIEKFKLPYERSQTADRYNYLKGSRADGGILYDSGQKIQIHHDSSPARGQQNSFDLVRLELYSDLDKGLDDSTPITERPSFKAMVSLVQQQPEVRATQAADELEDLGPLTAAELEAQANTASATGIGARPRVLLRHAHEIVAEKRETTWLLHKIVEARVLAVVAGARGTFKSFIVLDWLMRIALQGRTVVILSGEGAGIDRRIDAWMRTHAPDVDLKTLSVLVLERPLNLSMDADMQALSEAFEALPQKPAVVAVDTFSKFAAGVDENDNAEVAKYLSRLSENIRETFKSTVLLVVHTGHSDPNRPRGASSLMANPDAEYIVARPNPTAMTVTVSRERFKDGPALPGLTYEARAIDLGRCDSHGEPVTSLALTAVKRTQANTAEEMLARLITWWHNHDRKPFARSAVTRSSLQLRHIWPSGVTEKDAQLFVDSKIEDGTIVPAIDNVKGARAGAALTISSEVARRFLSEAAQWEAQAAESTTIQ